MKAYHKCRLCGETYTNGLTTGNVMIIQNIICDMNFKNVSDGGSNSIPIAMYEQHKCFSGDIGIADFIGFKNEG